MVEIIGEKTFGIARVAFLETQRCVSPGLVQGMESKRKILGVGEIGGKPSLC